MRIAFISTMGGSKWGGSEELWSLAARELQERGNDIYISIFEGVESERLDSLKKKGVVIERQKLPVNAHTVIGKGLRIVKDKLDNYLGKQFKGLLRFSPDVICVNLAGSYDILYSDELRNFLLNAGIPYTFICQGHDDIPFANQQDRQEVKEAFLGAGWVAFVSMANFESAQRHLAAELKHGFVVNNPANLDSIDYLPYPVIKEPVRFANVSRFDSRQKGHDLLFATLAKPQWKNREWTLSLAGSGIHEEYIKALVSFYGLEERVFFAGQVSDMRAFWQDHHILLLPSRYEGTPLALIESMLCGRTAVLTDVAGNTEWVNDSIGFISPAASVKYLEQSMEKMWQQKDKLEEMGRACHEKATTLFNKDIHKFVADKITGVIS